jgi:hypothetical protein
LSPLAVRLMQVRTLAREDPERPAHEVIEPLMLAVLAQRSGHSSATMTVGTDLGRRSHAWVAIWHAVMMVLQAGELSGKAGSLCKPCLRALILLFTSVCNMWVRIRLTRRGFFSLFAHLLGPCVRVSWLFKPMGSAAWTAVGYDVLVSFRR